MKYLLISGAEVEDYKFLKSEVEKYEPDFIIAVDRGADHLNKIGIKADLLIGDLDSISDDLKAMYKDKILKLKVEKDDTDTAVALDYAIKNNADEIRIYASVGSRFDHTLGNVLILKRALNSNIKCKLINEQNEIELHSKSFIFENMIGSTTSFFAMDEDVIITLKGFHYPLNEYRLNKYDPIAISNKVEKERAEVLFSGGNVLSVIAKDK